MISSLFAILFPPGNTSRRQWLLTLLAVFLVIIPSACLGRDVIAPAVIQSQAEALGLDTSAGPTGNWEYWSLYKKTRARCTGWCAAGGVAAGIALCMLLEHLLQERDRREVLPKNDLERWILGTYANFAVYYACLPEELEEKGPWKLLSRQANRNAEWRYIPNVPLYLGGRLRDEGNRNMTIQNLRKSWDIQTLQDLLNMVAYMSEGEGFQNCPDQAARAWQLCRSTQLLGQAYQAGWLSREEMVSRSCAVGRTIQTTFQGWTELNQRYIEGYERWAIRAGVPQEWIRVRLRIHEDLPARADSPFRLPWQLPLDPAYWTRRTKMERRLG